MKSTILMTKLCVYLCFLALISISAKAQETPNAAENLNIEWINGTDPLNRSIIVRWDAPSSGVAPDSYNIYYVTTDLFGASSTEFIQFNTTETEYRIPAGSIITGYPTHLVAVNPVKDIYENQQFTLVGLFDPLFEIDPNDVLTENLIQIRNGLIMAEPNTLLQSKIDAQVFGFPDAVLTYELIDGPTGLTIGFNTGEITWFAGEIGYDDFSVRISTEIQNKAISKVVPFRIQTGNPLRVEFTSTPPNSIRSGTDFVYDANAINLEDPNAPITYALEYSTSNGSGEEATIDPITGVLQWKAPQFSSEPFGFQALIVARSGRLFGYQQVEVFIADPITVYDYQYGVPQRTEVGMQFINRIFAYTLDSSYADLRFALANSPEGMKIDERSGEISWIPNEVGSYTYEVIVTNGIESVTKKFSVETFRGLRVEFPYYFITRLGEERSEKINALVSGIDNPQVKFSLVDAPEGMSLKDDGTISWLSNDKELAKRGEMIPVTIVAEYESLKSEFQFQAILYTEPETPAFIEPIDWNIPYWANEGEKYIANWEARIIAVPNATFKYSLKNAPMGMTIGNKTGTVEWNTSEKGLFYYTVVIEADNGMSTEFMYPLFVGDQYIEVDGDWEDKTYLMEMPIGTVGYEYQQGFTALSLSDGTTLDPNEYEYTLESAPEGMTIISGNPDIGLNFPMLISWTPERAGAYTVVLKATHPSSKGVARVRLTIYIMGNEVEGKMNEEILSRRRVSSVNDQPNNSSNLIVYPNPATNTISVVNTGAEPQQVTISDLLGNTVLQSTNSTIDVSSLSTGTYTVRVQRGLVNETTPLIIKR